MPRLCKDSLNQVVQVGQLFHLPRLPRPSLHIADEETRELALRIRSLKASHEEIASFVAYVKQEGGIEYADRVMHDYRDRALALLPKQMDESLRTSLAAYVDYVVERKK